MVEVRKPRGTILVMIGCSMADSWIQETDVVPIHTISIHCL